MAYFTADELRETYPNPLSNSTKYTDAKIERWRDYVEDRIEHACDVAFTPRTATNAVVSGNGSTLLELPNNRIRAVSAVSDDGTTVDITGLRVDGGSVYLAAGWTQGTSNLTVTYTHGYDAPPAAIKEAAMIWARELVVDGPITARATQFATEDGPINLATPGLFGAISGIPVVDQILSEYRVPSFVG